MADYKIDSAAANEAAALLRSLLQSEVPTGDFTEGSAVSDLLIDGHAIIAGYFKNQIEVIRQRQSLLTLQDLPDTESVSDAADALLDNFFRTRSSGTFSKGVATLYFSQRQDVLIPRTTRFFKTSALVFYLDSDADLFISASDMRPDIDANGLVTRYSTTVFLTAERVGSAYNVTPGLFVSFDRFNALLLSVENLSKFSYGTTAQTTADFITKSTNAIALRSLVNARSNDATLLERYSDIEATTTVGYGDPEMIRDLVTNVSNSVALHVGGHMDIFVRQNIQEVVERLSVGALQTRNDGKVLILRHSSGTPSSSFLLAGVVPGDILTIGEGVPEAPFQFVITGVSATELEIAARTPFSIATDESSTPVGLAYTVGNSYPSFRNKVNVPSTTLAVTSRQFSAFNQFQMPAFPAYAIKSVELLGPLPPPMLPYADALTGNVIFTARKNAPTLLAPATGNELGFFVSVKNPEETLSSRAIAMVEIGWPSVDLTGLSADVTYETQTGFSAVDAYVNSRLNRPACSNTLLRAFHPVYLYVSIPYRPRNTPADPLSTVIPIFDPVAAAVSLTAYLNNYRETEPLDVSLIATKARETSAAIAAIYAFSAQYDLMIPDGRLLRFETDDKITVFPDGTSSSARLTNPTDFGFPSVGYYTALAKLLSDQGITDRVTRYRVSDYAVVFERKA